MSDALSKEQVEKDIESLMNVGNWENARATMNGLLRHDAALRTRLAEQYQQLQHVVDVRDQLLTLMYDVLDQPRGLLLQDMPRVIAEHKQRLAECEQFQSALIDKLGWEPNLDSSGGDAVYRRKNWSTSEMEVVYASTIEEIIKEELG